MAVEGDVEMGEGGPQETALSSLAVALYAKAAEGETATLAERAELKLRLISQLTSIDKAHAAYDTLLSAHFVLTYNEGNFRSAASTLSSRLMNGGKSTSAAVQQLERLLFPPPHEDLMLGAAVHLLDELEAIGTLTDTLNALAALQEQEERWKLCLQTRILLLKRSGRREDSHTLLPFATLCVQREPSSRLCQSTFLELFTQALENATAENVKVYGAGELPLLALELLWSRGTSLDGKECGGEQLPLAWPDRERTSIICQRLAANNAVLLRAVKNVGTAKGLPDLVLYGRELLKSALVSELVGSIVTLDLLFVILLQYSGATVIAEVPLLYLPLFSLSQAHELLIGGGREGGPRKKKRKTAESSESSAMDESEDHDTDEDSDCWSIDENCRDLVGLLSLASECLERVRESAPCLSLLERVCNSKGGAWAKISLADALANKGETRQATEMLESLLLDLRTGRVPRDVLSTLSEGRVVAKELLVFSLELQMAAYFLLSGMDTLRGREVLYSLLSRVQCTGNGRVTQWKGGKNKCRVRMCFKEVTERTVALSAAELLIISCRATGDVGDAVVLSQYAWPYFEEEFSRISDSIKLKGEFAFREFFDSVVLVHILEEILYLLTKNVTVCITADHQQFHTGGSSMTRDLIVSHVESLHLPERHIDAVLLSFLKKRLATAEQVRRTM